MHEGDGFQKLLEKACIIFKLLAGPSRSDQPVLTDGKRSNRPFFLRIQEQYGTISIV